VRTADVPRLDTLTALELAAEEAARITGADGAAIAIGNNSAMCCCAKAGNAPDVGVLLGPDSGLSGVCLRTSQLVQCDDTASDPRVGAQAGRQLSIRSVLIAPVLVDGRLQAILEVMSSKPRAFSARHRDELSRMAKGIAMVLSHGSAQPSQADTAAAVADARRLERKPPAAQASSSDGAGVSPAPTVAPSTSRPSARVTEIRKQPDDVRTTAALAVEPPAEEVAASPLALSSLSSRANIGIGVAALAVLALGLYLVGGRRNSPRAEPAASSSSKASATAQPGEASAGTPEITVEQSSLSVAGSEAAPNVTGTAPQLRPGKLAHMVEPAYPASARARGISGSVVLTALVTKQGRVTNVNFVRGPEELSAPAIAAVQQWVYEPYRLGGAPVDVETMISIKFALRKRP
jgi:TonB family protein